MCSAASASTTEHVRSRSSAYMRQSLHFHDAFCTQRVISATRLVRMPPRKQQRVNVTETAATRDFRCQSETLQCGICLDIVSDAVQLPCCGALQCRKCILEWLHINPTCPQCRKSLIHTDLITDVRSDRMAAALIRPCCHVTLGCQIAGNRVDITGHEWQCDFVSRKLLLQEIVSLKMRVDCIPSLVQAALVGSNADVALATFYHLDSQFQVVDIPKQRGLVDCCALKIDDVDFGLEVHDMNFNVGIYIRRKAIGAVRSQFAVTLLHPQTASLAKPFLFGADLMNSVEPLDAKGYSNVMPSRAFDTFSAAGKFFFAVHRNMLA